MVRETRAAHTDDAACLHDVSDLLLGQLGVVSLNTEALDRLIQTVVFDDDRKHLASCRHRPRLDLLDLAGNGADDAGGNEPARLSDLLSNQDALADLDDRLGRSAEVLRHGQHDLTALRFQRSDGAVLREFLALVRMDATFKCCQSH